jgi:hypothetical protein
MERAPLREQMTRSQYVVCCLLGIGYSHAQVAEELDISRGTVRHHINAAVKKIPGDLPPVARCVAWVRGASLDVLEGKTHRYEMMKEAGA